MRVVVTGAGGVIGQHMMITCPPQIDALYCRTQEALGFRGVNLEDTAATLQFLETSQPDVIINLAGENRVDTVEAAPHRYEQLNVLVPDMLAEWCDMNDKHIIQVSTQGVFSGENPTYHPYALPNPITEYGRQKAEAEYLVQTYHNWTIARLTFVLGLRPFGLGRVNPVESMLSTDEQLQVNDRWFSPCFAKDGAKQLWMLAATKTKGIHHIGTPVRVSRYEIASALMQSLSAGAMGYKIMGVSHNHFPGIAPRPKDTTWAADALHDMSFSDGIRDITRSYIDKPRTKS